VGCQDVHGVQLTQNRVQWWYGILWTCWWAFGLINDGKCLLQLSDLPDSEEGLCYMEVRVFSGIILP
jgi:hypothetical protein